MNFLGYYYYYYYYLMRRIILTRSLFLSLNRKLLSFAQIRRYNRYFAALDTDFTDEIHYTGLGSIYLIQENLCNIELYNYKSK